MSPSQACPTCIVEVRTIGVWSHPHPRTSMAEVSSPAPLRTATLAGSASAITAMRGPGTTAVTPGARRPPTGRRFGLVPPHRGVAHQDAGDVGDRIARPGRQQADLDPEVPGTGAGGGGPGRGTPDGSRRDTVRTDDDGAGGVGGGLDAHRVLERRVVRRVDRSGRAPGTQVRVRRPRRAAGAPIHDATDHGLEALAAVHHARFLAVPRDGIRALGGRRPSGGSRVALRDRVHWFPAGGPRGGDPARPAATIRAELGRYAMDTMTPIGDGMGGRRRRATPPPRLRTSCCWARRRPMRSAVLRVTTPGRTSSEVVAIPTMLQSLLRVPAEAGVSLPLSSTRRPPRQRHAGLLLGRSGVFYVLQSTPA